MLPVKKKVFCLRIPAHIDKLIKDEAQRMGITQNAFIMNSINRELDKAKRMKVKEA